MITFDVGVILPAAGSGQRVKGATSRPTTPKQYLPIAGKPLFQYALEAFCQLPWVKKIVLVVDNPAIVEGLIKESNQTQEKILVVRGDTTRHRSIRAGLLALQKHQTKNCFHVVVVHDAVRPFLPEKSWMESLVLEAERHGAAGSYLPLVSTVLEHGPGDFLHKVLDRSKYVSSETPQAFQLHVLTLAYNKCSEKDLNDGTECLQLVLEYTGIKPKLIEGSSDLWKVTYKKDVYAAIASVKEKTSQVCIISPVVTESAQILSETLKNKISRVELIFEDLREPNDFSDYKKFNSLVIFCELGIQPDNLQLHKVCLLDRTPGLIIIVKEPTIGMNDTFTYVHQFVDATKWEAMNKGIVTINRKETSDTKRLVDLISILILSDVYAFSGQTFFV